MRALVLEDFGDLRVVERNRPSPAGDEMLIKTIATGICGSDVHGFTGENGRRAPGQIMGHETVGRVEALGAAVDDRLKPGDLVTINPVIACQRCPACRAGNEQHCPTKRVIGVDADLISSFAEYTVVPARNVVALDEGLRPEYGALVEPLAVAHHAVRRGRVTGDDALLVLGGGPIGQSVIIAASRLGVTTIFASEPDPRRRTLCARLGAVPLDPSAGPIDRQLADRHGAVDVAVDAVGASATVADALASTALGGRVVLVGMSSPDVALAAYRVSVGERTIVGSYTYPAAEFVEMARFVSGGPAQLETLIDERVPLADAPNAFARLAGGTGPAGKVVVMF